MDSQILWIISNIYSLILVALFIFLISTLLAYKKSKKHHKLRMTQYISSIGLFLSSILPFIHFYNFVFAQKETGTFRVPIEQVLSHIVPRSLFSLIVIILFFIILLITIKIDNGKQN